MWNGCYLVDEEVFVISVGVGVFFCLWEVVWFGVKLVSEMFLRGLLLVLDFLLVCFVLGFEIFFGWRSVCG